MARVDAGRDVLAHLVGQVDQHAVDAGAHAERVELLLLQREDRLGLLDLGLLHGELRLDRGLVEREPLVLEAYCGGSARPPCPWRRCS